MGLQRLAKAHYVEITHKAFVLRPHHQENAVFTDYHLQHRFAARLRTELPYAVPAEGTRYPSSSLPALEAAKWVEDRRPDRFADFDARLFTAFFEHAHDISDSDVLVEEARLAGVDDADALREALAAGTHRDDVMRDHHEAMARGITGIPAVLIGGELISGAVPYEVYEAALRS